MKFTRGFHLWESVVSEKRHWRWLFVWEQRDCSNVMNKISSLTDGLTASEWVSEATFLRLSSGHVIFMCQTTDGVGFDFMSDMFFDTFLTPPPPLFPPFIHLAQLVILLILQPFVPFKPKTMLSEAGWRVEGHCCGVFLKGWEVIEEIHFPAGPKLHRP